MALVFIGLGSNIEPERHLRAAIAALHALLGPVALSSVFESEAVGFDGPPFLNLVARGETALDVVAVVDRIRAIERALGRRPDEPRFANHCVDLDLLLYDAICVTAPVVLPRPEITENAYVLWPLAELAADLRHPLEGRTYGELWAAYDKGRQRLKPVPFSWTEQP